MPRCQNYEENSPRRTRDNSFKAWTRSSVEVTGYGGGIVGSSIDEQGRKSKVVNGVT